MMLCPSGSDRNKNTVIMFHNLVNVEFPFAYRCNKVTGNGESIRLDKTGY